MTCELDFDLTPLSLDEVESFLFEDRRESLQELDHRLADDIERWLGEPITAAYHGAPEYLDKLYESVHEWNKQRSARFRRDAYCSKCELGLAVKSRNPLRCEIWVDWRGMPDDRANQLPKEIHRSLMDKYIEGWRGYLQDGANQKAIVQYLQEEISGRLKSYVGQVNNRTNRERMFAEIKRTLESSGVVDECEVFQPDPLTRWNDLHMKVKLTDCPQDIYFTAQIK